MSRYIDADALCEHLQNKLKTDYEMGLYNHGALTESFIRFVERQPTADVVEVRHGHWKYLWLDAVCSECGYINEADVVTRCRSDPPYCPKCGAKMDGERSENDND